MNLNIHNETDQTLKKAIWLYFFLVVFEGALRKWVLPGLSSPLLIVRDPVAIFIIILATRRGFFTMNFFTIILSIISVVAIFTAIFLGHQNIYVAVYGARVFLIHFPLIFIIGNVLNKEDVVQLGKVILCLVPLMTILIGFQFFSPQSAWVNRGIGGDEGGAGFSGAMGFLRPPGTFSFTNGNTAFYAFSTPFILYFWLESKYANKAILILASLGLVAAIPLSISRGLFFSTIVSLLFTFFAISRKPGYMGKSILIVVCAGLLFVILGQLSFFETATAAFTQRLESANEAEGGVESVLLDRYFGGMVQALTGTEDLPVFGYGIGMGTNLGSQLLTGELTFLIAEGEWGRLIGEMGPFLGLITILTRLVFCIWISIMAYQKLAKGELLPWLLLGYGLLTIPQGGWAQPTSLGFSVSIAGLILASLNIKNKSLSSQELSN